MDMDKLMDASYILQDLGFNRGESMVLSYFLLNNSRDVKAVDIEYATRLRQPEVSVAVNHLIQRGWLTSKTTSTDKRGRPFYLYNIIGDRNTLLYNIRREIQNVIRKLRDDIRRLEEVVV